MTLPRWLILLASIVLFAAGVLHMIGYFHLVPALAKSGIDPGVLGALKCVWIVFTVELVILAAAFLWLSRRAGTRSLVLYLALIPVIDAILMYYFVGSFIGSNLVAGGSVLLLAGAWLLPRGRDGMA
jgi:hypothetical protein